MVGKRESFIDKLAAQVKAWTAEISLQDAKAEKEKVVEIKHRFIESLKY